ncbi:hypothetical protein GCM10020218_107170 [Dactylosporangium vinaceum]
MSSTRRHRLADVVCVVACLALGALLLRFGDAGWARHGAVPAVSWAADAAVGTAGSLLVWYRHRNPIIVALLLLPLGAVSGSVTPALAVSVYAVAVHRPARQAVLIAADNVISVLMYFGLQVDPRHPLAVDLIVRGI